MPLTELDFEVIRMSNIIKEPGWTSEMIYKRLEAALPGYREVIGEKRLMEELQKIKKSKIQNMKYWIEQYENSPQYSDSKDNWFATMAQQEREKILLLEQT